MKKYILVHSQLRDEYKVAEYLYKYNKLAYFVTDDILFRKKYRSLVPYNKIKISYIAVFFRFFELIFPRKKFNLKKDYWLSHKAGKLSLKKGLPIFSYSYYATQAFSISNVHPKILFQLHPHPYSVRNIFVDELKRNPLSKYSLSQENELKYTDDELKNLAKEPEFADFLIVASSFTKNTLVENGILPEKVSVVPYGVDLINFTPRKKFRIIDGTLRFLFVGSFNQRKGLTYMLQSFEELQNEGVNISLTLCGRGIMDIDVLKKFKIDDLSYYVNLPLERLVKLMHDSNIFIFPSLCEGFGAVLLQAMATGLPIITTNRTSGCDFITEGNEGFIIEPQNVPSIKKSIMKFVDNPEIVEVMGKLAIAKSKEYNWERFGSALITSINQFEENNLYV